MVKLLTSVAAIAAISQLVTATATGATNDNDASVERHRQRRHATERPTNDNNNIFNDEHKNVFAVDVNGTKPSLTNMEYDGSSVGDKYDSGPSVTPYIVGGQAVNPPRKYGVSYYSHRVYIFEATLQSTLYLASNKTSIYLYIFSSSISYIQRCTVLRFIRWMRRVINSTQHCPISSTLQRNIRNGNTRYA